MQWSLILLIGVSFMMLYAHGLPCLGYIWGSRREMWGGGLIGDSKSGKGFASWKQCSLTN